MKIVSFVTVVIQLYHIINAIQYIFSSKFRMQFNAALKEGTKFKG